METISCKEAREKISEVVNKVTYGHERYIITRHGNQVAVLISFDDWKAIEEILEKLEDQEDIRDAEKAMKRLKKEGGKSLDQLKSIMAHPFFGLHADETKPVESQMEELRGGR